MGLAGVPFFVLSMKMVFACPGHLKPGASGVGGPSPEDANADCPFGLTSLDSSWELPNGVDGGGPAGVKDPNAGPGGPAGVVDGFEATLLSKALVRCLGRVSGVEGGLEEKLVVKVGILVDRVRLFNCN